MSKSKLDPREVADLKQRGHNNYSIARIFDVDEATVRRALRKADTALPPRRWLDDDAAKFVSTTEKPIVLSVKKRPVAISADWHVPLTRADLVDEALTEWAAHDCRDLVVAGDFWNEDGLSAFDYKQEDANLLREWESGNRLMARLLDQFDNVYFTYGNHDARITKALHHRLKFTESMRLMFGELPLDARARLHLTNLDFVLVDSPRGRYRVCHPKAYSSQPLVNARKLAGKYLTHVLCGHSHHSAIGTDVSGQFLCAELGGFFDVDATDYLQRSTAHARWTNGWGMIHEDGTFTLNAELWRVN